MVKNTIFQVSFRLLVLIQEISTISICNDKPGHQTARFIQNKLTRCGNFEYFYKMTKGDCSPKKTKSISH